MKLTLQRRPSAGGCTIGELSIDGVFECYTLEDTVREIPGQPVSKWKIQNVTAIGAGVFRIIIDLSQRFQRRMMHVLGVDGFDGIRIHSGNFAGDTDGCVLVGTKVAPDCRSILFSATALAALQTKVQAALDRAEEVTIEILNAPQSTT